MNVLTRRFLPVFCPCSARPRMARLLLARAAGEDDVAPSGHHNRGDPIARLFHRPASANAIIMGPAS